MIENPQSRLLQAIELYGVNISKLDCLNPGGTDTLYFDSGAYLELPRDTRKKYGTALEVLKDGDVEFVEVSPEFTNRHYPYIKVRFEDLDRYFMILEENGLAKYSRIGGELISRGRPHETKYPEERPKTTKKDSSRPWWVAFFLRCKS
jgi:hypothetical protein